jgi:porin
MTVPAHSEPAPSAQEDVREPSGALRPGEYPNYLFKPPAFPAPTAEESQEFREKYLFGDWLGERPELAKSGIKPSLLFILDPFGNVTGGRQRGFSQYNLAVLDVTLETDKLLSWPGGQFHVGFANSSGTDLSTTYVGNNFPIQLAAAGAPAGSRLTYLSYTQSLFNEILSIRLGRLTINSVYGEEFLGSAYFKAFTSVGFDLVTLGPFLNAPGAFGYPFATWGARIKFEPVDQFYVMTGVYNGDPALKEVNKHGVDFSLKGPPFAIGEFGFRRNYGKEPTGLPGNLKFGAYFNGGTFETFDSGPAGRVAAKTEQGNYGLYVLGDQAILRWGGPGENRHLGIFTAFTWAPDQRVNKVPYFVDAGLVAYGVLPSRPHDFAGFGVVYGSYSSDLGRAEQVRAATSPSVAVQNNEMTLELTYGYAVMPGLILQPDLQYIINPGGNRAISNALAIGVNVVVNF